MGLVTASLASLAVAWASLIQASSSLAAAQATASEVHQLRKSLADEREHRRSHEHRSHDHEPPPAAVPVTPIKQLPVGEVRPLFQMERLVYRSTVDELIEDVARKMHPTRITPSPPQPLRVDDGGPETLLGRLGFVTGDEVAAVNGFDITTPEQALNAYSLLRQAGYLDVRLVRNHAMMTLHFHVFEDGNAASR